MKLNDYTNIICALIIGIAVITGSLILHNSNNNSETKIVATKNYDEMKPLITVKEAAEYLGIPETEVWTIINFEENNYDLGIRFPVIKIEKNKYVSTSGLIDWLRSSVNDVKKYN